MTSALEHHADIRSSTDDLELINKWLRRRFDLSDPDLRVADSESRRDVTKLKDAFVNQKVHDLLRLFGISEPLTITVRSSFRANSLYLRPVFSKPLSLSKILLNPEIQRPFEYTVRRGRSPFDRLLGVFPEQFQDAPRTFAALHKINSSDPATAVSGTNCFTHRINAFWKLLTKPEGTNQPWIKSPWPNKPTYCLFAGRNKSNLGRHELKLQHIAAVYFQCELEINKTKLGAKLRKAQSICGALFDGLDLIAAIDATLFRSEGLELVANLSAQFARNDIAPADKIAFAIEKLKRLLSLHMVGRHGGGTEPNVFYLTATFERDEEHKLMPRLEMYPHIYRELYPFGSFLVAHQSVPSATKFLLRHYMQSKKHLIVETAPDMETASPSGLRQAVLSKKFLSVFTAENLGTVGVKSWENIVCSEDYPDFLDMMLHDERLQAPHVTKRKSPWNALNRSLNPGSETRSIAAFVVEGKTILSEPGKVSRKCLPRGVFAVESEYIDAFSDRDINSLRAVFSGIATLIRQISHQHAPIEYRARVAEAFEPLVPDRVVDWRSEAARLLFLVQKLDGKELKALQDSILHAMEIGGGEADIIKEVEINSDDQKIIKKISEIVAPLQNNLSEIDAKTLLESRMRTLRSELASERSALYNRPNAIKF